MKQQTSQANNKINQMIVFMIIIFSTSSLVVITRMSTEIFFVLLAIGTVLIYALWGKRVNKTYLLINAMLSLLILTSMLLNLDMGIINVSFILLPWYGCSIYQIMSKEEFSHHYCNCMVFLAIYSLIAHYFLLFVVPGVVDLFPIRQNSGGYDVHDFILAFRYVSIVSKNTGLFREMGVYAVYLNFALYFLLFELESMKRRVFKCAILFVTVLSTLSTPGIIAAVLLLTAKFIEIIKKSKVSEWKKLVGVVCVSGVFFMLVVATVPIVFDYLSSSMDKLTKGGSSLYGRVGSIIAYISVWIHSPIWGVGYQKSVSMAKDYYDYSEVLHNTSSNSSLLAMYGVVYVVVLYSKIFLNVYKKKIFTVSKIIAIIALLMLMECQYMILDSLWWVFMWYFIIDEKGLSKNASKK